MDWGYAIALDGAGNAYVTGETWSSNFPTTPGAFDTSHNGNSDAFVVKLNPAGSGLVYATFLGGSDYDYGNAIARGRGGQRLRDG
ncbi:MAG: SBBP repeat-containing protein [Anaerolineae bacterium]